MASISTVTQRRLGRLTRRRDRIFRTPAYTGHPFLYRFDASLRFVGVGEHHDSILQMTGMNPTHIHRKGEPRFARSVRLWEEDVWSLQSPLDDSATLDQHLHWLCDTVAPHSEYFRDLISRASRAEIILGCFSESPYPFLSVTAESLRLVRELNLGISFNFTCV